jgi:N4-gp56 family major capsid protein
MTKLNYNLQLFAEMNTNTTGSAGLSDEMKTYYSDYLIDNAIPKLVHDQFGQKHPIPKNGGKTIEFRKYSPLPKLLEPIREGYTPDGQSLNMSTIEATVAQYGGYITLSDVLLLTAIDNNLVQATKLLGAQAGATLDTITREVLNGGTNVIFSGGKEARGDLDATSVLTVDDVKKAVRLLKNQNAEKINGSWVGIIHPDIAYDLTNDPAWKDVKTYSDPDDIYEGEIGKLYGVRFVETTEAKIWSKGGSGGQAVYSTLILGDNAYGTTEVTGGGLQHIVKQLGSAGTSDPLDQRATAGWKAIKVAERLVENYMVRIESGSTFNPDKDN